jgi:hypothetical protein
MNSLREGHVTCLRRDISDATIETTFPLRSARRLYNATLVIFGIVQFQRWRVPDEAVSSRRGDVNAVTVVVSYEWIIVASGAREQDSVLGLEAQKKTRGQPVKNWRVIRDVIYVKYLEWQTVVVSVLRPVARRRLVETGNPGACATLVCKWEIALYCWL